MTALPPEDHARLRKSTKLGVTQNVKPRQSRVILHKCFVLHRTLTEAISDPDITACVVGNDSGWTLRPPITYSVAFSSNRELGLPLLSSRLPMAAPGGINTPQSLRLGSRELNSWIWATRSSNRVERCLGHGVVVPHRVDHGTDYHSLLLRWFVR